MPEAIKPGFEVESPAWGIRQDGQLRYYYGAYFEAMDEHLKEGIRLLDYGAGSGRFVNYLSERVDNFEYWGVDQNNNFGQQSIAYGRTIFGHDPRVHLGVVGGAEDAEGHAKADTIVLSSVFTHVNFDTYTSIMADFMPIMDRGGIVVFSCFLADYEYYHPASLYGPKTYGMAFYTTDQLSQWQTDTGYELVYVTKRFVDDNHLIYRAQKPSLALPAQ